MCCEQGPSLHDIIKITAMGVTMLSLQYFSRGIQIDLGGGAAVQTLVKMTVITLFNILRLGVKDSKVAMIQGC